VNSSSIQGYVASSSLDSDPRWGLVTRVALSDRFAKAPRLREFLLYVCQASLQQRFNDINEQSVGEHVFERAKNYNPSDDNIVRSQARLLRQKLDAYFASEGAHEPLIVRIPKGGYVPEFVTRLSPTPEAAVLEESPAPTRPTGLVIAVLGLSVTVVVLAWALIRTKESKPIAAPTPPSRALSSLWSQFFSDTLTTTVVVPDHTFSLLEEASRQNLGLDAYLKKSPSEDNERARQFQTFFNKQFSDRRYTTFDGVSTAVRISQIADKFHGKMMVRYARDLTLRDLTPGNVILIGRPSANPWVELFESKLNFQVHVDFKRQRTVWLNRSPRPGEQSEYVPKRVGNRLEAYGSVAFVPNLSGGNVLIIEGACCSSQEGAAEFVTDDALLARLADKLNPNGARMPYFDALMNTTTIDQVTQEPSLIACRVLTK
jgi:hypothetical protein